MHLDKLLQFSDDQNLTATATSTNTIDLSSDRKIGIGEPVGVVVTASTAFGGTTPTIDVQVQSGSTDTPTTIVATSGERSTFGEGDSIVVPLGYLNDRYLRLNFVLGGTSPDTTVDAYLQPLNMIDGYVNYEDGYNIT